MLIERMNWPHEPTPSDLVALDMVLSTRSVTRAAERLGVSQSALSHRLRRLREVFGDPLLVGSRQGLTPTPRAEAMAEPLRRALADLRIATQIGEPFDPATSTRTFVVATSDYGEIVALPAALHILQREAPGIVVHAEAIGPDVPARLGSGAVDLAVTVAADLPPSLRQKRIARERYRVALRAGHPALRGRRKLTLASYCGLDHLLVSPRGLPGSAVDEALGACGLTRRVALRVPHFVAAPFIVAGSDLVTTLGEPLLCAASRYVDLAIVPPPLPLPTTDIVMVWHERTQHSPPHRLLRRIVERAIATVMGRP